MSNLTLHSTRWIEKNKAESRLGGNAALNSTNFNVKLRHSSHNVRFYWDTRTHYEIYKICDRNIARENDFLEVGSIYEFLLQTEWINS